jgi:hypothetical protein
VTKVVAVPDRKIIICPYKTNISNIFITEMQIVL